MLIMRNANNFTFDILYKRRIIRFNGVVNITHTNAKVFE